MNTNDKQARFEFVDDFVNRFCEYPNVFYAIIGADHPDFLAEEYETFWNHWHDDEGNFVDLNEDPQCFEWFQDCYLYQIIQEVNEELWHYCEIDEYVREIVIPEYDGNVLEFYNDFEGMKAHEIADSYDYDNIVSEVYDLVLWQD